MDQLYLYVNIGIIFLFVAMMILGYRNGLIYELLRFLFSVASVFISYSLYKPLANAMPLIKEESIQQVLLKPFAPILNQILWFLIICVACKLISSFVVPLFKFISKLPLLGSLNKLIGLIFGFINACFWCFLLSMLLVLPIIPNGKELRENTLLKPINEYTNLFLNNISTNVDVENFSSDYQEIKKDFMNWLLDTVTGDNNE